MANWTVKEVTTWLKENGFRKQMKAFKEKNIDGQALLQLTDQDISQLFSELQEDGTVQEPTIGVQSRFRLLLAEWKMNPPDCVTSDSLRIIQTTDQHDESSIVQDKPKKKKNDDVKLEVMYLIDNEIEVRFFENPKFRTYFINYVQHETSQMEIEINRIAVDESTINYTIKLTGFKHQNRITRNFIKHLLQSIKCKTYKRKDIKNWMITSGLTDTIEYILNRENEFFVVCRAYSSKLGIYYFDNEKFNPPSNLIQIDDIIQNQIIQERIGWRSIENRHTVECVHWKYQICKSTQFNEEFEEILNQYKPEKALVFIITNRSIELFGDKTQMHEVLQKLKDLFDKHRLRKYRFSQLSSTELNCLANLCPNELFAVKREFRNDSVQIDIEKNEFYASQCLKEEIRTRIKALLSNLKSKIFKNLEFYLTSTEPICTTIKNLARRNKCYCEINAPTKLKSYPIPSGHGDLAKTSKTVIEQANAFSLSCQAKLDHGSIEVLIGDIALQKVDVLIIPSTFFGLKESLIERAGEIIEKPSSTTNHPVSFITETTGGKLNCQKILFVNWSLPTTIINDDELSESIRFFVSQSMKYAIKDSQSMAFAMPDLGKQEEIFAEEVVEETLNQIKSSALKVLFVVSPDQQTLHQRLINTIERVQHGAKVFACPTTTVTISLMSFDEECLTRCENKINHFLERSVFKMKLDGFEHWNQYFINAFYKYSTDRGVLPKTDHQQQIILYGPISNVNEVNQKYQLTNALIQQKQSLPTTIVISYSPEDSKIAHRLANRLTDEGFTVWINSDPSMGFKKTYRKIAKSTCVILCISENYFENQFCEKEAKYAEQIGKILIPVKVEYYHPIEWLQKLIEKESYFQFFGSENHFNFEFDKLLLKIVLEPTSNNEIIKPNSNVFFLLTAEQKKLRYKTNVKKLIKSDKGKIDEDEKQEITTKLQEIIRLREKAWDTHSNQDRFKKSTDNRVQLKRFCLGIISYQQWLDKLKGMKTLLNIPPFTFTGDVNDAIFPLLNGLLQNSDLLYSMRKYDSMQIEASYTPKRRIITIDKPKTDFGRSSVVLRLWSNRSKEVSSPEVKKKRKRTSKAPPVKASSLSPRIIECRSKFAEQMQKNIDEFEQFCAAHEHSSISSTKRKIQVYSTAIFGPSPFSDTPIKPPKRPPPGNQRDLPLKFPWNGVFDTEIPTVKRKDPSIFFSFEV